MRPEDPTDGERSSTFQAPHPEAGGGELLPAEAPGPTLDALEASQLFGNPPVNESWTSLPLTMPSGERVEGGQPYMAPGEDGGNSTFKHAGVLITASSGDSGFGVEYPSQTEYPADEVDTFPRSGRESYWGGSSQIIGDPGVTLRQRGWIPRAVIGVVVLLVLLVGGSGFIAARQGVFGCHTFGGTCGSSSSSVPLLLAATATTTSVSPTAATSIPQPTATAKPRPTTISVPPGHLETNPTTQSADCDRGESWPSPITTLANTGGKTVTWTSSTGDTNTSSTIALSPSHGSLAPGKSVKVSVSGSDELAGATLTLTFSGGSTTAKVAIDCQGP